jgi:hypothetical protein
MKSSARRVTTAGAAWLHPAIITALGDGGLIEVRVSQGGGTSAVQQVRLAQLAGYRPTVGDRVLCAGHDDGEAWAVAVLHAAEPRALELEDGTRAELHDDELSLCDRDGQLLVRYRSGGSAAIAAPAGDLELLAPAGKVVVDAATDIELRAHRDLSQVAQRRASMEAGGRAQRLELSPQRASLRASRLDVTAKQSRLSSGSISVLARTIATTADRVAAHVEDYDLTADRIRQKARNLLSEVQELAESRLGRARSIVRGTFDLHAERTTVRSERETVVDGERILLG